jgi:Protein of unknown function (DUF2711)
MKDKRILAPPEDIPILDFYDGAFTKAFIALHPFIKIQEGQDQPVRWSEICCDIGFEYHRALDRTLRTSIIGLRSEFADPKGADKLIHACELGNIYLPSEGVFQSCMQRDLVSMIKSTGLTEVVIADEFDNEQLINSSSLSDVQEWCFSEELIPQVPRRIFATDKSMLIFVDWDSFCTTIIGTDERLSVSIENFFEGFWCSNTTTVWWLDEPLIPIA